MYGYIRPNRGELRLREYDQYRAAYCGLCESLRRRHGLLARFIVNYDFTFLAVASIGSCRAESRRCPVHPLRRRPCLCQSAALDSAADQSVILAWWKLRDDVEDKPFLHSIPARIGLVLLRKAFRRACDSQKSFAENTENCLRELSRLEKENCSSLDRTADCFARILRQAAAETEDLRERRIRQELFYHIGRSVYILDAVDDLPEDRKKGNYNPLLFRFSMDEGGLKESDRETVRATLNQSQRAAAGALLLRDKDLWQPILENIVMVGLPDITELVLSGRWREKNHAFSYRILSTGGR